MNEQTQKTIDEISKMILTQPIETQNEIFVSVRQVLIRERLAHIRSEKEKIDCHAKEIDFAESTLKNVFMSSIDAEPKQSSGR